MKGEKQEKMQEMTVLGLEKDDLRRHQTRAIRELRIPGRIHHLRSPNPRGGMNGYLSLCSGDPCPPIFRSVIMGMEDIMNNQVICAIYILPDAHKHISRPPEGVIFPKKSVTIGDLKPPPALWHEDTGRKPWERQNNPGNNGGRQLGEEAHRLVNNSLQLKTQRVDQTHASHQSYGNLYGVHPYPNGLQHYNRESQRAVPYHNDRCPNPTVREFEPPNGPVHYLYERQSDTQYERNTWPTTQRINHPMQGYPLISHPNAHFQYPPQQVMPAPGAYVQPRGVYYGYGAHQSYGSSSYHHQGGWQVSPADHRDFSRGYNPQQHSDHHYSNSGRGANRRPPPPHGYNY